MESIKFEKVHFSYEDGGEDVFDSTARFSLDGIDLVIEEGEFVAILGHNGSGKSTLARLTNGLLTPTEGKITVLGLDACDEKNLFEIRKNVGIVFQNPDNQTVASIVEDDVAFGPENIGVPRAEIGKRIDFALKAVAMEKYRYSTTSRLSGGQKQRIAIAGVLALKPRIMILDESTAMLDPRGRKEVIDVVLKLNKEEKITVVLVTHFPEEALLADRAILMNGGRIVAQGKPETLLRDEELLKSCSLALPRLVKIERALQKGGVDVSDGFELQPLVESLAGKLQGTKKEEETVCVQPTQKTTFGAGDIVCENLHFTYNPASPFETQALNGIDLRIDSGDFFGILGHTGSGKSTFVQHLNALIKLPTAQKKYKEKKKKKIEVTTKLVVNGFDLTDKNTDFKALRKRVGMVFQYPEYQLFAETVFQDVAFGLKNFSSEYTKEEIERAVKEALERVGLSYEEVKDRSPFELSGGQKRRVAIAGVIVTKPEILVLDEPGAGLDPLGKEAMMQLLHDLHADWCKTVVIVSHDMDEIAENCNRAGIFSEGKVLAVDTPKNLFTIENTQKAGLDLPLVKKLIYQLEELNISLDCKPTIEDFVDCIVNRLWAGICQQQGGQTNA